MLPGSRKILSIELDLEMSLEFGWSDYFIFGAAASILVLALVLFRDKFSGDEGFRFAMLLNLVVNPLLLIWIFGKIFLYSKVQPLTLLNAGGFVQAVSTIASLCEAVSIFMVFQMRKAVDGVKPTVMWLCVNAALAVLCLWEAPKLIWPLSARLITSYTLPAILGFGIINLVSGLYVLSLMRKNKR